ncbi:SusC/RagA family TonB-linked outer membrane protein [Sinomicrobium weinanense]|uniref:TonB-dependent receptor n=1 Tax=Sinomicrobium weinanense TaxID=2842200 RepID=A0A926JUW1_9FLAO|nr:TonB-dependent receptor [Sinomicrobium weinanense]MBC9797998.1 TonB-dependent receptor [Sinomicrobium weinanense]MBU3125589.1 TonB-dependent receptor [Sinomicrobium weinanense]
MKKKVCNPSRMIPECLLCGLILLLFSFSTASAQGISGKVIGEDGQPIPGVNVIVEGTTTGTITDFDGNYEISPGTSDPVLTFSYIGYETKRVPVGEQKIINITLVSDVEALKEVVVIGYGTQTRTNMTSAISTINPEEVMARQTPSTISLLQGRSPGLQIVQNSSLPGAESNQIRIRGQGTFSSAGSNPLILIDGVEGRLELLNPNMIEDISVLKDAASAAVYGSRAANGVILVTTKKGKGGRLNVEYSYNYSVQKPSIKIKRISDPVEYMELVNKAIDYSGQQPQWRYTDEEINMYRNGEIPTADWTEWLIRDSPIHKHFLNFSGGKEGTTFNAGLGILDEEGLLLATDYKRYDAQVNFKTNLGGRVTFGSNISLAKDKRHDTAFQTGSRPSQLLTSNGSEDQMLAAYAAPPLSTPELPDGSGRFTGLVLENKGGNKNPIAIAKGGGGKEWVSTYLMFSPYINVEIIEGLSAEIKGAFRFEEEMGKAFVAVAETYEFFAPHNFSGITASTNSLFQRNTRENQYTLFGTINYEKTFKEVHNLTAMVGYQQENYRNDRLEAYRTNLSSKELWEIDAGPPAVQNNGGTAFEWALQSFFGRVNYNYMDKYLFEASFRNDASSRFPEANRWAFFPSVSVGWRMAEEAFFSNVNWVSELKLRGSWGQLGNQNIGNYPYQSTLSTTEYNFDGTLVQGITLRDLINSNIKWETTTVTDIGIDFSLFNSALHGSVDWYKKTTKDILRDLQVPSHIGVGAPVINDGILENTGWEFTLGYRNSIGDFNYSINANLETYKNELIKFGAREISGVNLREEGLPYNQYYVLINDGVYQNQAEIDNGPVPDYSGSTPPKPGALKYRDISGPDGVPDGRIDLQYDRVPVDGVFPKINYGLNFDFNYKSFDLSVFVQGVHGRKTYVREWGVSPFRQASAPPVWWRGAWDGEGTSNTIPHIYIDGWSPNSPNSTFWLGNSSYWRIKNLQLGYTLPVDMAGKLLMKNFRVYVSADNLYTHTKFFQGLDPERASSGSSRGAIYPQATIYSFGVRATF